MSTPSLASRRLQAKWYHLAGVYEANAQSASRYVKSTGAGGHYLPCGAPAAAGHTGIGQGQFAGNYVGWVNGSIDEVRLYGELIQNRDCYKDDPTPPVHWPVVQDNGGAGSIAADTSQPVPNTALTASLKVSVTHGPRVGAANEGYFVISRSF